MTDALAEEVEPGGLDAADTGTSLTDFVSMQVKVAMAPLATVTSLVLEALDVRRGSPAAWHGPVRQALTPTDLARFGPVLGSTPFIPDCMVPPPGAHAPSFDDELERVASTTGEELVADLEADGMLDSAWSEVARAPRRWLGAYTALLERAWTGARPLWEQSLPLLEHEVERVGTALARGSLDVVIDGLHPEGHVEDGQFFLTCRYGPVALGRGLVLAPVVGGDRATFMSCSTGVVRYLAYPLAAGWRLSRETVCPPGDGLVALLGEPRADLLRRLDRATTGTALAESMLYVPSSITHHVGALERAGLVRRERAGRQVLVHRTARGTALLDIYDR